MMTCAARTSLHVERLAALRLAGRIEGDLLHPRLGLAQQLLAAALEHLAALVDRDRLLERDLALLESLDDRLELLDRPLEGELADVRVVGFGHVSIQETRDSGTASSQMMDCPVKPGNEEKPGLPALPAHQGFHVDGDRLRQPLQVVAA